MKITIHEEKNSHFTFHGEKKGRSRVTKIPFTTLFNLMRTYVTHTLKALANEDTLLRTHCCRHKCFPVCPRAQHLLRTQILCPEHKKMFLILFRNILCLQQMFPSLRSPRNIMDGNVYATMCPRLPGPLHISISYLCFTRAHVTCKRTFTVRFFVWRMPTCNNELFYTD